MARDLIHNAVRNAMIKDGWRITDDPFRLSYGDLRTEADIAAEKTFAAERGTERIVVEVKSFAGRSAVQNFKEALGSYTLYQGLVEIVAPERRLYLAIDKRIHETLFSRQGVELLRHRFGVNLMVVDTYSEEIVAWIE